MRKRKEKMGKEEKSRTWHEYKENQGINKMEKRKLNRGKRRWKEK